MKLKNITIYSIKPCPYCDRAKSFLKSKNLTYKEHDLTNNQTEIDKLKSQTGHLTFPQIFINDQFIGGYSDLISKTESGEIKL